MTLFLALLAAPFVCGLVLMAVCLFNAPEGYEDESGFHIAWSNNSAELADVARIWSCGPKGGAPKGA